MPFFTLPLALLALASLPMLIAIYWLRRQHRRRVVSSLLLWDVPRRARQGGVRVEPVRTPWLFLLEAGVLALLAVAAAQPWLTLGLGERPLIVVLDDSFSMQAGARERAVQRLREVVHERSPETMRFVIAGAQPRWVDVGRRGEGRLNDIVEAWEAMSAEADLAEAIAMAREVAGPRAQVLVMTDEAPDFGAQGERGLEPVGAALVGVRWEAFGEAQANVGFINAVRSSDVLGPARVMLEVASFADVPVERTLRLGDGRTRSLMLEPGEVRRLWFDAPPGEAVEAELSDDALVVDNRVVLLEPWTPRVRVAMDIERLSVAQPIRRAIEAMPMVELVEQRPHILFTDQSPPSGGDPATWLVQVVVAERTRAYLGPFVLDRTHPLTEGLSLDRVIWSADDPADHGEAATPGRVLIAAGNVPLITQWTRPDRTRLVRWHWRPEHSTLQQTNDFPALIWNLMRWRQRHMPGLSETNLRLGMLATLRVGQTLEDASEAVRITDPRHETRTMRLVDDTVHLEAERPGIYELEAGPATYRFAVNALAAAQSDLRDKTSGVWDGWTQPDPADDEARHRSLQWLLLLLALGLLVVHGRLVMRST